MPKIKNWKQAAISTIISPLWLICATFVYMFYPIVESIYDVVVEEIK